MHYFRLFSSVLFIISICLFEVACKEPKKKPKRIENEKQRQGSSKVSDNVKEDTLKTKIGKPQILAYSLSQPEYDALPVKTRSEYDEGYSDFSQGLEEFAAHNPQKLIVRETASRFILIAGAIVDRKSLQKYDYGVIFITKTGSFKVFEGGLSGHEIEQESKSLFR
jgi:hypothetical protein